MRQTGPVMKPSATPALPDGPIVVRPATIERFDDIGPVINRSCWCQWWRLTAAEYSRSTSASHRAALRDQCAADPVPGVVAYLGDLPVGWCGFGPRSAMRRLERSRTIPAIDGQPVWSIVCFDVRPGYRRRGVANALLAGAIEELKLEERAAAVIGDQAELGLDLRVEHQYHPRSLKVTLTAKKIAVTRSPTRHMNICRPRSSDFSAAVRSSARAERAPSSWARYISRALTRLPTSVTAAVTSRKPSRISWRISLKSRRSSPVKGPP